ncbi:2-oxoacid:acceptor oxidoreductase subunit alpha [Candidatus Palauibacter sp.]|uniref:2-oxoacid:acceptor oxidoreductase subunit alpha n=1 Tax=Candidatus Palauibacter sp. TaxID=3101350 RepID=UPI003B012BBE
MSGMKSERINDFAFKIATVNGTGSASANGLIMQLIFRMGVPVSGKNVFPSNIQGLPTWYEIRVNGTGHVARRPDFDLIVAMNPETYARDIEELVPGGWLLYDSSWPMADTLKRDDVNFLGVPLAEMCVKNFEGGRTRILMKNIAYTGALAALLDLDMEVIRGLLEETFGERKRHLLDANFKAIRMGYDYAAEHFECPLPIRLERMDATRDSILIDGNTAAALGCVYAGATVAAWYPITPSTSLVDAFTAYCRRLRVEEGSGRSKAAILQAEDELAAAGITIGAGWAGARAFTSTSGAGISLMTEFIGLAYYAEIPCVFFDIERVGPSTGMPTRTQQGDILLCAYASHGDTKHICLYPKDPAECFEFSVQAFDLAERFQTPVFVLSDLDIGMNDWVVPRFRWDDTYRPDRGKVLDAEALEEVETFYRYLDVDGDGIPYRTIPGEHPKGAYFTRGSGHTKYGKYTEDEEEYLEVIDRIAVKIENAAEAVPPPEIRSRPGAQYGLITLGACDGAVREAIDQFDEEGLRFDYMRIRGFPFTPEVTRFIEAHDVNIVIEQNRDAQLKSLLTLETPVSKEKFASVRRYGGLPLSARQVTEDVSDCLGIAAKSAEGVGA